MMKEYPELPRATVEALGIETSYYHAGASNAPTVILLHGMSTSADSFREVMHELSDSLRLIAPDIPGFGHSENTTPYTMPHLVEWLATFIDELALPPAHFVGHSFGGILGPAYALSYPSDVLSHIWLAPALLTPGNYPEWVRNLSKSSVSEKVLGLGVQASRLMLQRQIKAAFHAPDKLPESLWERRTEDYFRSRASAAVLRASAMTDLRPDIHKLTQPVCLIWGRNDTVVDPAGAETLATLLPQSETHLIDECSHAPQLEHLDEVVAIMRRFLS